MFEYTVKVTIKTKRDYGTRISGAEDLMKMVVFADEIKGKIYRPRTPEEMKADRDKALKEMTAKREREAENDRRQIHNQMGASHDRFKRWQTETFGDADEMSPEARQAEYDHEAEMERESERAYIRRKYGVESE